MHGYKGLKSLQSYRKFAVVPLGLIISTSALRQPSITTVNGQNPVASREIVDYNSVIRERAERQFTSNLS